MEGVWKEAVVAYFGGLGKIPFMSLCPFCNFDFIIAFDTQKTKSLTEVCVYAVKVFGENEVLGRGEWLASRSGHFISEEVVPRSC
jgi:hypothetical protein